MVITHEHELFMLIGCDAKLMADHYVQGPCLIVENFNDSMNDSMIRSKLILQAGHRKAGRPCVSLRIEERVIALARTYPVMGSRRIGASKG